MHIQNEGHIRRTPIVCAESGDAIDACIARALELVGVPKTAFAYVDHNGVIVTLDKQSTAESALADWRARLAIMNNTFVDAVMATASPPVRTAKAIKASVNERGQFDWDKYDANHGRLAQTISA